MLQEATGFWLVPILRGPQKSESKGRNVKLASQTGKMDGAEFRALSPAKGEEDPKIAIWNWAEPRPFKTTQAKKRQPVKRTLRLVRI